MFVFSFFFNQLRSIDSLTLLYIWVPSYLLLSKKSICVSQTMQLFMDRLDEIYSRYFHTTKKDKEEHSLLWPSHSPLYNTSFHFREFYLMRWHYNTTLKQEQKHQHRKINGKNNIGLVIMKKKRNAPEMWAKERRFLRLYAFFAK